MINEIFYNAPDDLDLEFVELHSTSDHVVDLSSWTLADRKDTLFEFAKGTMLEPDGFLVLCRASDLFEEFYGFKAAGELSHGLGNGGDEVVLKDQSDKVIDQVAYEDSHPWHAAADGSSASLERIHPHAPGMSPYSWAPSPSSRHYQTHPSGSPGTTNAAFASPNSPQVKGVTALGARVDLGSPITVKIELEATSPTAKAIQLVYQVVTGKEMGPEVALQAKAEGRVFTATIPTTRDEAIVRYWVLAEGEHGEMRRFPHQHSLRPAFSIFVSDPVTINEIPVVQFILPEEDFLTDDRHRFFWQNDPTEERLAQGKAAFVVTDPETKATEVFDFVHITRRSGGYRVRMHKDRLWHGMSTINMLGTEPERHSFCESLAYEFHRRAGVPASWAGYFRLRLDGIDQQIYLAFEQPNKAFLRRHQLDDDGNLYKAIWQGNHTPSQRAYPDGLKKQSRLIGRHEKKTNVHEDYDDLVVLVEALERGNALAEPDGIINYLAANSLLSHWDGFHNNYFLYHEVSKKVDKWWMLPWDQDKTWGYHDDIQGDEVFVDLPINAGMEGFLPPNKTGADEQFRNAIGLQGAPWYRYGGEVSRKVLVHPEMRRLFLKRLRELAMTVYTEEIFGPEIDRLEQRLLPEMNSPQEARLRNTLNIFRKHLRERRLFVLDQPEIRALEDSER